MIHSLRWRIPLSLVFPEIGINVSQAVVIVVDTYSGAIMDMGFQAGWRRARTGALGVIYN